MGDGSVVLLYVGHMESKKPSFGELDLGWDEVSETATPVSGVRQAKIVPGLAARRDSTRPSGEDHTRVGDSPLESGMLRDGVLEASGSGAGTMDDPRLDQVRALYARGDTAAALAFAEKMRSDKPPPGSQRPRPPSNAPARAPSTAPEKSNSAPPPASARSFAQTVAQAVRAAQVPRAPEPYADIQDEGVSSEAHPSDQEHGTAIFAAGAGEALMQVASLSGTPYLAMTLAEVQKLPLDPRAGFLMSIIDGASTIADLCDLAGMPEDELVSVLTELARHKVIAFK